VNDYDTVDEALDGLRDLDPGDPMYKILSASVYDTARPKMPMDDAAYLGDSLDDGEIDDAAEVISDYLDPAGTDL
jgi:hypothetical protein